MYKFYVSIDENGYPTSVPVTEIADGLVEFIAYTTADKEYFTRNYLHYRRDENQNWQAPDNLPSLTVSALLRSQQDQGQMIADRDQKIETLQTSLTTAQADAKKAKTDATDAQSKLITTTQTLIQLQQMAVQSSQAQAQSASSNSEMKTMLVQITQAMATLQAGNTKTTE